MVFIPTNRPGLPPVEALQNGARALGSCVSALSSAINGSLGFDTLRVTANYCQIGDWKTIDNGDSAGTLPIHTRITPSPMAQKLFVAIVYCANTTRTGPVPSLVLEVKTVAGVAVDAGFTLTAARGVARNREYRLSDAAGNRYKSRGALASAEQIVTTGWIADPIGTGGPRLLDISGKAGEDLTLIVTPTGVRIYSIIAIEAYQSEVT